MTPTLFGRWQTRTLLLLTFGLFFTLPFVLFYGLTPLLILGMVLFFGYFWDILYQVLQSWRWDRDWPPAYQFLAGLWEAIFVFGVTLVLRRFLAVFDVPLLVFIIHYGLVWWATFLASQSLMRIVFPNWRYRGGQWLF
jgi:hypothetical protein